MKPELIDRIKKHFEEEKQKILEQGIVDQDLQLKPEELADETDLITSERETSLKLRLRGRSSLYLRKIDAALTRIREQKFGICESCEDSIGESRILARPTASLCLHCKESEERREHLFAHSRVPRSPGSRLRTASGD